MKSLVIPAIAKSVQKSGVWVAGIMLLLILSACSNNNEPDVSAVAANSATKLEVYKSPTCGCCKDWVDHMEDDGFQTLVHHPADLSGVKQQYGISSEHQSCHTAISEEGYVFEGHVPSELVKRFLENPPKGAAGLAVPGMPIGSPGMEMGDRVDQYSVFILYKDGRSEHFAEVKGVEVLDD